MRLFGLVGAALVALGSFVPGVRAAPESAEAPDAERLSVDGLSPAGAVEWGPPDEPAVVIFTDYRCPYSRAMIHELSDLGAHVIEYPISILGSRDLANAVICAPDRAMTMRDAYARVPLPVGTCNTAGLDANEAFAAQHGISEVPVIVRSDGTVLRGFVGGDQLAAWLDADEQ